MILAGIFGGGVPALLGVLVVVVFICLVARIFGAGSPGGPGTGHPWGDG